MTLVKHELRQGRTAFLAWTGAVGFLMAVCLFLYPEMKKEMAGVSKLFASMGAFTAAFGMDRLDFGTLTGYYAIECGNVLGLGGAFYASLCAAGILSKEEKERTAEFLLTHPVSRSRVLTEKALSVFLRITAMNLLIWLLSVGCVAAVGEAVPWKEMNLLHLAFWLMQLELAGICFGVSAFLRRGSTAAGLGIAAVMYFLQLIANITESAAFLNRITPFGYCGGADIVTAGSLDGGRVAAGMLLGAAGVLAGYLRYTTRDIR